jgi:membrane associated rhomboid family serine protease
LGWLFGAFGIGCFVWLIMLVIPKMDESVLNAEGGPLTLKKEKGNNDLKEISLLLLPRPGYTTTPIIIDLNILIFVLMVLAGKGFISFQSTDLLAGGANYRPMTAGANQWWRLLTSIFLHAGIMHLLFNMAGLLFAGILLEPALGKGRLVAVYLLTGIAASLTSLWWHPATVSVGASGAIFGLYGVVLALLTTKYFPPVFKKSFTAGVLIFVGGNLLVGLTGGIDNAAHVGGLVSGLVAGYILYAKLKTEKEEQEFG